MRGTPASCIASCKRRDRRRRRDHPLDRLQHHDLGPRPRRQVAGAPSRRCTTPSRLGPQANGSAMKTLGRLLHRDDHAVRANGRGRRGGSGARRAVAGRARQRRRRRRRHDRRSARRSRPTRSSRCSARSRRRSGTSGTVIAGTGGNNTRHSVELTKAAEQTGVDGVLSPSCRTYKPTQDGMLRALRRDRRSDARCRSIIYNIPGRTGANMLPATFAELARRHANIVGDQRVERRRRPVHRDPARPRARGLHVLVGRRLLLPAVARARRRRLIVSVAGHLCGRELRAMADAFDARRRRHGRRAFTAISRRCSPRCSRPRARSR